MRVRNITTCALGLAAALTLVASPLAAQSQDTTRLRTTSQTRISVSKGEVVTPARIDTVYVTRYDTIRVNKHDRSCGHGDGHGSSACRLAKIKGPCTGACSLERLAVWQHRPCLHQRLPGGACSGWESQQACSDYVWTAQ